LKKGFFSKIGAGYGTKGHYSSERMFSIFSPSNQLSVVGATNNINTTAYDITTLMQNNSFKSVKTNVEYQPNFSLPGLNVSTSAGSNFQHDFIPNASNSKYNRLNGCQPVNRFQQKPI
jgi:hypothetical protein